MARNPGVGTPLWKGQGYLLSQVQIKDSGHTKGVDDETSPFLAVKVSFRVHSKE